MKTALLAIVLSAPGFAGDGLDPAALLHPPPDSWPTYNGDYSGRRYSPLSQINQSNVNQLTLAWMAPMHSAAIKSTPLLVNGVLYSTTPDNVWARDARTGRVVWHYHRESHGDHIGHRGVGMYKDWLYFDHRRLPSDCAQRERRHGAVGHRTRRLQAGLLRHHGAAGDSGSRAGRRVGRRHRHSGLSRFARSGSPASCSGAGTPSPSRASPVRKPGRRAPTPSRTAAA